MFSQLDRLEQLRWINTIELNELQNLQCREKIEYQDGGKKPFRKSDRPKKKGPYKKTFVKKADALMGAIPLGSQNLRNLCPHVCTFVASQRCQ